MSDAGRSWVITAYVLTFGGLMLLGGRLGDTIGRKRTFIVGVALFTIASILCGVAWDEATLVDRPAAAGCRRGDRHRPTGLALVATTFPKGPARNAATAVFAAMTGVGSVMGLVVGGALTEVSWRLAFLVNVPIGLVMIYLARTTLRETHRERMKLDAAGALLATLGCTAAVFGFSQGPENGWLTPVTLGSARWRVRGVRRVRHRRAHGGEPRRAVRPVPRPQPGGDVRRGVPGRRRDVHADGADRPVRAGHHGLQRAARRASAFIPFVIALGVGLGLSSHLVSRFSPRVLVIGGGILVLGAMVYGSTLNRGIPYFPNLVIPITVGGFGIGMIVVPLTVSAIAGVGFDRIGPVSAIALMLQNLGGPVVLAIIQAVITSRTLYLGGTTGPVKNMNDAQLAALDSGYTYGLLWVAAVAVLVGGAALFIGYTAEQVAHAQEVKDAIDAGEL